MNRLKKLRVGAGLPLRVLEKYLNIPNATLSLIENGKQPMREIHVQKITNFFDVTSDYLLGYSNTGIGIYFASSEDDNDHEYISASELEKLKESYEVREDLLHRTNTEPWVIRTSVYEEKVYTSEYILFRSVNISKEKASISASLREQIVNKLNSYDTRQLEKLLMFMKEYIER